MNPDPVVTGVTQSPAVIAGAIVLVLSSIGGTIVLVINALSASKDRREAAAERLQQLTLARAAAQTATDTSKKADALVEGQAKIHELTNSTNSQLQKALELKTQELAGVRELVAQMEKTAKEIAATRTLTDVQTASALRTPVPGQFTHQPDALTDVVPPVLKAIEANTAATTDAVKDLKSPP